MVILKNGLSKQKGRPGRPQAQEPRNERIVLRVTDNELTLIKARALAEGKTISRYLREVALRGGSVDLSVLVRLNRILAPIGSNVNQAVKALNSWRYPDELFEQWETLRIAIKEIQGAVSELQGRLK